MKSKGLFLVPTSITQDVTFGDRKALYKKVVFPPPRGEQYLKVVIRYSKEKGKGKIGEFRTAYSCGSIKAGEVILWTK